jgi:hypothetical protein
VKLVNGEFCTDVAAYAHIAEVSKANGRLTVKISDAYKFPKE